MDVLPKTEYLSSLDCDGLLSTPKQVAAKMSLMQSASHITDSSPVNDWAEYAACKGQTNLFFRHACVKKCRSHGCRRLKSVKMCREICESCPVLTQCRLWALTNMTMGVAGGMTEFERFDLAYMLKIVPEEPQPLWPW